MSASTALIILIIGIVIAILLGNKFKINSGIVCIAFAYIIGCYFLNNGVMAVIGLFPIKIMFLTFSVCFFFGFHTKNGTFDVLSKKLLYKFRNATWAMPLVLVLVTAIISVLGAGTTGSVVAVAPVAYVLAKESKYPSVFVALLVNLGSLIGGVAPWSPVGALMRAYATGFYGEETAVTLVLRLWAATAATAIILSLLAYLIFGGFKSRKIEIEKAPDFNEEQKKSLTMIIIFIALAIIPTLGRQIFGGPVFSLLASKLDVQMVAVILGIICAILKMGNEREIIAKEVPWSLVLLSGGFAMFIAVCSSAGAVDLIASLVKEGMSGNSVSAIMATIGAALSFVADGLNVGFGTFGPTFPTIAQTTGLPMLGIALSFIVGTSITAFSPFSMGGALVLSFNKDKESSTKQFTQQIIIAILEAIVVIILAFLGFYNLFG